jgi:hypothetical protein
MYDEVGNEVWANSGCLNQSKQSGNQPPNLSLNKIISKFDDYFSNLFLFDFCCSLFSISADAFLLSIEDD